MGMTWADLLGAYLQYRAADKAGDQKPQYSISPQMDELFKRMMAMMDYSPTRDYISSYADSFIKSQNAPGGALSWKPTFQSDYMKNQQPLPNTALDLTKVGNGIFNGDKNNLMPWNYGYTGPGMGGKMTRPPGGPVGPNGNPIGNGGGRPGGRVGAMNRDFAPDSGGWSSDYYNNPYNGGPGYGASNPNSPDYRGPQAPNGAYDGMEPRDEYGQLISSMNANSPEAQRQWNQWFGGLTPEQRRAELAKAAKLDQFVMGLGGKVGDYVKASIKDDPLGFAAAVTTASASGGVSLLLFLANRGLNAAAGHIWNGIQGGYDWFKNGISNIFGNGNNGNGSGQPQPGAPVYSPWGRPGGR